MDLNISSVTVFQRPRGCDIIHIHTADLPAPSLPDQNSTLVLHFDAAKGSGVKYVRKHFDIEPRVIESV